MVDIRHRIGVKDITPEDAYQAIATREGIAAWWVAETTGDDTVGGTLSFGADIKAQVTELRPDERVRWQVIAGPDEWIGTHLIFDIKLDGDYTIILFTHQGWAEPVEFMHHCSTKWGVFLVSLKQYLDSGTGAPAPHDVHIGNWA